MADYYYLACAGGSPAQIQIQKIAKGANVATAVSLTTIYDTFPTAKHIQFSPRAKYMVISRNSGTWTGSSLRIFRRVNEDSYEEIDDTHVVYPTATVNGLIQDIRFSPDGKFLAVCSSTTSMFRFTIFVIDKATDTFTATQDITSTGAWSCDWSPDSKYVFVAQNTAPYIRCFSVASDGTLTDVTNVNTQFTSTPRILRMSPDGQVLAAALSSTPYMWFYSVSGAALTQITGTPTVNTAIPNGMEWFGSNHLNLAFNSANGSMATIRRVGTTFYYRLLTRPASATTAMVASSPDMIRSAYAVSSSSIERMWVMDYTSTTEEFTQNTNITASNAVAQNTVSFSLMQPDATNSGDQAYLYNSALYDLLNSTVDLANLKICLINSTAVLAFDPTHTTFTQAVGTNEIYDTDWTQGGILLPNVLFEKLSTSDVSLTFDQAAHTYMGTTIEFSGAVIYDNTHVDKKPLALVKFAEAQVATQLDEMRFSMVNGILIQLTPEV